jgi:hypothetical protein
MKVKPCCEWMRLSLEKGVVFLREDSCLQKVGAEPNYFAYQCSACKKPIELEEEKPVRPEEDVAKIVGKPFGDRLAETNKMVNKLADRVDKLIKTSYDLDNNNLRVLLLLSEKLDKLERGNDKVQVDIADRLDKLESNRKGK